MDFNVFGIHNELESTHTFIKKTSKNGGQKASPKNWVSNKAVLQNKTKKTKQKKTNKTKRPSFSVSEINFSS